MMPVAVKSLKNLSDADSVSSSLALGSCQRLLSVTSELV